MSSLKNASKAASKPHRERAQPAARQRLGLLEKHKDYAARARDYRQKQATLRSLRRKAAERNDDEFAFGMMSRAGPGTALTRGRRGFTGTVDGDRGNKALSVETVRLMKTQDVQYVRTMRSVALKEVRELEQRVVMAGGGEEHQVDDNDDDDGFGFEELKQKKSQPASKAKKIVFMAGVDERDQVLQKPEVEKEDDDDEASANGKSTNADRKAQRLAKLGRRLKTARDKLQALDDAERALDLQRARMAKTRTYGGITKSGKKIKIRERKR